jgi:hypothetical protein
VHLDDEAHRDVLVHLVLQARQRRHERDAVVEHRREREDRVAGAHGDPSATADALPVTVRTGCARQEDVVAEALGEQQRHLLQAADDALVEDEVGVDEVRVAAGGCRHQQRLQQRERVRRLREHRRTGREGEVAHPRRRRSAGAARHPTRRRPTRRPSCAQGRSGSISATIASRRSVISAIAFSVSGATGNISPVKRCATPSGPT